MTDPETRPVAPASVGSRVDAGTKTQSGPLGRIDPPRPAPPGTVPRPPVRVATGTVLIGFAGLIASLVVLGSLADGVRDQEVFALDTWATPFLHGISSPALDAFFNTLTALGSSLVVLPIFLVAVALLTLRRRYGATLFLSVALAGSLAIDFTMKLIFQRPRPKLDYAAVLPDYSFPSGHSMNGVVFYVSLALIAWSVFGRRVGVTALAISIVLAFGIGVSRIYLGYHYLTDVVGGFLAGTVWLLVVGAAFRARPQVWHWGSIKPRGPTVG
jgi:undecaprenyl-diphosphatase